MSNFKKAVIVVHRHESKDDFQQIARRIRNLDPTIGVTMVSDFLTSKMVPPEYLNLPMLVIYLCNPPKTEFKVATKIAVKEMSKIEEYEHFKQHNIPCLPIERFKWGMELDPAIYGDWVVLKPEHIQSTGKDVNMVPTKEIPNLKLSDFPKDHLIYRDSYYIQKLLKTGDRPNTYRATVFMGAILSSGFARMIYHYPSESSDLHILLSTTIATNFLSHRTRHFEKDKEANELALRVADSFPENPLLAIDILKNEDTGENYVLETNLGGNTWHFSSALARNYPGYDDAARKAAIRQYNVWDRSAEALVKKTNALAK
jgi:hypothetical protein